MGSDWSTGDVHVTGEHSLVNLEGTRVYGA